MNDKINTQAMIDWLEAMEVKNYHIHQGEINVNGDVGLSDKGLSSFPYPFGLVSGVFSCKQNSLTSLKNSPRFVKQMYCADNELVSLQGLSQACTILSCGRNKITSLEGCPDTVEYLDAEKNQISSLKGVSQNIKTLLLSYNCLTDTQGLPATIRTFQADHNQIKKLEALPFTMDYLDISHNPIESLEGSPKEMNDLIASHMRLKNLRGGPFHVSDTYDVSHNQLTSLQGLELCHNLILAHNELKTLEHIKQATGRLIVFDNPLESLEAVRDLMCHSLEVTFSDMEDIFNTLMVNYTLLVVQEKIEKTAHRTDLMELVKEYKNSRKVYDKEEVEKMYESFLLNKKLHETLPVKEMGVMMDRKKI